MKTMSKMTVHITFLAAVASLLAAGCGQEAASVDKELTETIQSPITVPTPESVPVLPAEPVLNPVTLPASKLPEIAQETAVPPASPVHTPEIMETDGIHLDEIIVARGIEQRQPVEPGTSFELDPEKRIYAFMKVANPDAEASEVTVSWVPVDGGNERGKINVSVGPQKRWRTWAFTRAIKTPGMWKVIVRNIDGEVIAEAPFEVTKNS